MAAGCADVQVVAHAFDVDGYASCYRFAFLVGTRVPVVAVQGSAGDAVTTVARVVHRAWIQVVARVGVVGMEAALVRVAHIVSAWVAIGADDRDALSALASFAALSFGTEIAIDTRSTVRGLDLQAYALFRIAGIEQACRRDTPRIMAVLVAVTLEHLFHALIGRVMLDVIELRCIVYFPSDLIRDRVWRHDGIIAGWVSIT